MLLNGYFRASTYRALQAYTIEYALKTDFKKNPFWSRAHELQLSVECCVEPIFRAVNSDADGFSPRRKKNRNRLNKRETQRYYYYYYTANNVLSSR